jgi:hypothetical protein
MKEMKRFILMFVAIMFFANTYAVSAWAKPCVNNAAPSISQGMSNMPCHDGGEQENTAKHCDGLCLCAHAAISQTPILSDNLDLYVPISSTERLGAHNEPLTSMAATPPRRPPKHIS